MRALVTGATGFIGRALCARLDKPVVLSRNAEKAKKALGDVTVHEWADPTGSAPPAEAFEGVDTVFHLAGESVLGRWTDAKKEAIRSSRVDATTKLVEAMLALEEKPKTFVCASAIGWYGNRGDDLLLEDNPLPGEDFLGQVCADWEKAAKKAARKGPRTVMARIGVVLGNGGGTYANMKTPFQLCLGGRLATGQQWFSWIHLADLVEMLLWAARTESVSGPMNAVAPNPVINLDFTRALGRSLGRPTPFPVPALALRAILGELADGLLLTSNRCRPQVGLDGGFEWKYPTIQACLDQLATGKEPSAPAAPTPPEKKEDAA